MFFIKAILMSILPFYSIEFPVNLLPKEFTYIEFKQGREVEKRTITADEETYTALQKVVSVERQGWRYDLVTYAPNRMFNSPKMKINCLDNALVVNYEDNDGWIQISKKGVQCPTVNLQPRK